MKKLATKVWIVAAAALVVTMVLVSVAPSHHPVAQHHPVARQQQVQVKPGAPFTLRVLAGSELGGMTKILAQAAARTGVTVKLTNLSETDSFTAAQELANGTAQRKYDAVWFGSNDYFGLFPPASNYLTDATPVMTSPVVLAVESSAASRLGWANGSTTWQDIAEAAGAGDFEFGMASPATSEAGLAGLVAVATATARAHGPLREGEIRAIAPELTAMFQKQVMSAPDSVDLTNAYLKELRHPEPGLPDGVIDDEADLISLVAVAKASRAAPLTMVYPSNGVVQLDYPLTLLTTAKHAAGNAFKRLVAYLTSPAVQRQIEATTHFRPVVNPSQPDGGRPTDLDVVPSPGSPGTLQRLIQLYLSQFRAPARTVFVLDTSGSMGTDQGLADLKAILNVLTGAVASPAAKFSEFRDGEEVTFLPFNYQPTKYPASFSIPPSGPGATLAEIRRYVDTLQANGRTNIYDSLVDAYQILKQQDESEPGRIDSIVLITDGMNNEGRNLYTKGKGTESFYAFYNSLWAHIEPAPVYAIAVGAASPTQLRKLADITGGTFRNGEGEPASVLDTIIEDIRGYQ
jgi:Ca-activated chloride channel family protein